MSKYGFMIEMCLRSQTNNNFREHLGIALALNVPVMVVITKIDICPPQILDQTIVQLTKILKSPGARKIPVFIRTHEECINTAVSLVLPSLSTASTC
jgi:GTPase